MRNDIPVGVLSVRSKPVKSKKGRRIQRKTELQAISPVLYLETDELPGVGGPVPISRSSDPLLVIPDNSYEKSASVYDSDKVNERLSAELNKRGWGLGKDEDVGFGEFWPGETNKDMTGDLLGMGSVGRSFKNSNGTGYRGLSGGQQVRSQSIIEFREELKAIAAKYQIPEDHKLTWEEAKESGEGILVYCEQEKLKMPDIAIELGYEEMIKVVEKQLSWRK